jgi:hypothetical protein
VRQLSKLIGEAAVAEWCVGLLAERLRYDDRRRPPITWLGGAHAAGLLARPESRELDYFPRVWAARALLYAWDRSAAPVVGGALHDPAWRVREMAAKVIRKRGITGWERRLEALTADPVARVREAATRALDSL